MEHNQTVMDRISVLYDQLFDAEKKIAKFNGYLSLNYPQMFYNILPFDII